MLIKMFWKQLLVLTMDSLSQNLYTFMSNACMYRKGNDNYLYSCNQAGKVGLIMRVPCTKSYKTKFLTRALCLLDRIKPNPSRSEDEISGLKISGSIKILHGFVK